MNENRKPPVGIERLEVAPLTADTMASLAYGSNHQFGKAFMTADDQSTSNSTPLFADNQEVRRATSKTGGTINLGITQLIAQEYGIFLGSQVVSGGKGYVSNKNDASKEVAVMYMTTNDDDTVNLHKFFACTFTKGQKSKQSKGDGAVTYQVDSLSGTYRPLRFNGNDMAELFDLDRVADALIIEKWYDEPEWTPDVSTVKLTALSFGALTLSPTFSGDKLTYTATTSSATNTITATAEAGATMVIIFNGNSVANGASLTWETGINQVNITVSKDGFNTTYGVSVTKTT